MIKIITKGPENFEATCSRCLYRFTYEVSDLFQQYSSSEYVNCPQCGQMLLHMFDYKNAYLNAGTVKEMDGTSW